MYSIKYLKHTALYVKQKVIDCSLDEIIPRNKRTPRLIENNSPAHIHRIIQSAYRIGTVLIFIVSNIPTAYFYQLI